MGFWVEKADTSDIFRFNNGDGLLQHRTLKGDHGKLLISRISGNDLIWQLDDQSIYEATDMEMDKAEVKYAYGDDAHLILFLRVDFGEGDIYMLSVDPENGKILKSIQIR